MPINVTATDQNVSVGVSGGQGPAGPEGPAGATYVLPAATGSVLGGVRIGSGVTITDGVISVSTNYAASNHTHDDRYYTEAEADAMLAAKAPLANPTFTGTVSGITRSMVGLGSADNTSDADKPVSTAQAAADAAVLAASVQRDNHTGTQLAATISDFSAAVQAAAPVLSVGGRTGAVTLTAADVSGLSQVATSGSASDLKTGILDDARLSVNVVKHGDSRLEDSREWWAATIAQAEAEAGTATTRRAFTALRVFQAIAAWWAGSAAAAKLAGIAAGATANATDAQLRDRATHTGTQDAGTIAGLSAIATSGSASDLASGTVATARLGGGTANATTFLRGDQAYASVCDTFVFTRSAAPASASGSGGNYTWTVPATAKVITLDCTSGGGGGGSGRRGAAGTVRGGGGGGGGGGRTVYTFPLVELSDRTLEIIVGNGGAGAAAVAANDSNGTTGTGGGVSLVRIAAVIDGSGMLCYSWGGNGGSGGTTSGGAGGAPSWVNTFPASTGGAGGTGAAGAAPTFSTQAAYGGGGGGGISAGDVAFAGGMSYAREITRNPTNGNNGGAVGAAGGAGAAVQAGGSGNGGGGGGASITAAAGAGGNGSAYGGGGGGGGASLNGNASGAGGNGGDGVVRITVWY